MTDRSRPASDHSRAARAGTPTASSPVSPSLWQSVAAPAVAGVAAAGMAIAVAEVFAGLVQGAPSLVITIGDLVIEMQPAGAKDLMVGLFGENTKAALNLMVLGGALLTGAIVGIAARRRWWTGVAALLLAGAVALGLALREPLASAPLAVITVAAAITVGLLTLRALIATTSPPWARATPSEPQADGGTPARAMMPDWGRRHFVVQATTIGAVSLMLGAVGRNLLQSRAEAPISADPFSSVSGTVPGSAVGQDGNLDLPAGTSLDVPGIAPIVTASDQFFRIDTQLVVPRVDVATWKMTVKGMVDREITLTYDDLLDMPLFEQYVTLQCVSNAVGGGLVGNALWQGVHLRDVLDMAGVHPDATQIVGRSVDRYTAGFPTEWAMDPVRDPMIALGMNGAVLRPDHGYPARLIVPGLYGYVSATKWLGEIELTTMEAFDAYWVPFGWAKEAPILTQSRIDVPRYGARLAAGPVVIAGVAWAPDRGIERVEVRVDNGEWMLASLSLPLSSAAWVQWKVDWEATPGSHRLEVRATDGTGEVQTDERTPPDPDGARGHHVIDVHVA